MSQHPKWFFFPRYLAGVSPLPPPPPSIYKNTLPSWSTVPPPPPKKKLQILTGQLGIDQMSKWPVCQNLSMKGALPFDPPAWRWVCVGWRGPHSVGPEPPAPPSPAPSVAPGLAPPWDPGTPADTGPGSSPAFAAMEEETRSRQKLTHWRRFDFATTLHLP